MPQWTHPAIVVWETGSVCGQFQSNWSSLSTFGCASGLSQRNCCNLYRITKTLFKQEKKKKEGTLFHNLVHGWRGEGWVWPWLRAAHWPMHFMACTNDFFFFPWSMQILMQGATVLCHSKCSDHGLQSHRHLSGEGATVRDWYACVQPGGMPACLGALSSCCCLQWDGDPFSKEVPVLSQYPKLRDGKPIKSDTPSLPCLGSSAGAQANIGTVSLAGVTSCIWHYCA